EHEHEGKDPHIWMSPKRVVVMIEKIRDELINIDNENKEIYNDNAKKYIDELKSVDSEIKTILKGNEKESFIIFHPSMGYFAEDYNLEMVAIEESGKEATAKKLENVIDFAKKKKIKFVFYQEEFDDSQAKTIADEIGGSTLKIAPLDSDYIENLKEIANSFKKVLR
ncbi:MAG: zinc ABC transporter substrate-binding protein, partial [Clostridiales bacterium]